MLERKKYDAVAGLERGSLRSRADDLTVGAEGPVLVNRLADTTSHRDRDAIDHSVVRLLFEFLSARSVTLYHLAKDESGEIQVALRASLRYGSDMVETGVGDEHEALPALTSDPLWQESQSTRGMATHEDVSRNSYRYVFPLDDHRQVVVGFLDVSLGATLPPRDVTMIQGVLRILKNQLALLDYGERDTLTGLLNRRTFEHRFEKIVETLRAQNAAAGDAKASWIGLVDIDHFKSINDLHGHLFGDEVLLLLSQIMRNTFRGSDQLFRFGGEEFVIVLDRADPHGANVAFERLRNAVREFRFPHGKGVTITLGYTRVAAADVVSTTCIERADTALYFGKRHGRDAVHEFESLIDRGLLKVAAVAGDIDLF
jgi:diguanylate cyclase (GGDEF)-like protein